MNNNNNPESKFDELYRQFDNLQRNRGEATPDNGKKLDENGHVVDANNNRVSPNEGTAAYLKSVTNDDGSIDLVNEKGRIVDHIPSPQETIGKSKKPKQLTNNPNKNPIVHVDKGMSDVLFLTGIILVAAPLFVYLVYMIM